MSLILLSLMSGAEAMENDYTSEEAREEQTEIFSNFKADIEDNPELSDTEKERQINQLELEYSQLQERWNAEDIQKEREENYVSRDEGLDLD